MVSPCHDGARRFGELSGCVNFGMPWGCYQDSLGVGKSLFAGTVDSRFTPSDIEVYAVQG